MNGQLRLRRAVRWSPGGVGKLNDASATSILDAVGKELIRPDIDKAAMIRGVNLCRQWYQSAREFSTNKGIRERNRRLEMIYKKAKALDHLLAKDDSWLPLGVAPSSKNVFCTPVKRLIEVIDRAIKQPNEGTKEAYCDSFKVRSPFEWLVAYFLLDVFGLLDIAPIVDQKELISRKSPYIRFVQAVLAELSIGLDGKPYSPASIIKAVRNRFAGRVRRKGTSRRNEFAFWRNSLLRKEMGLPPPPMPREPQAGFYALPITLEAPEAGGQN
jgi:hypothetical protein